MVMMPPVYKTLFPFAGILAAALARPLAAEQTIYRSVDETGAVRFSDTPPEGGRAVETLTLELPAARDPGLYRERLEAMRATTDRMAADRRAREKHRAELRALAARSAPAPAPDLAAHYPPLWYGSRGGAYYYRPGHPPWRPGLRPRPQPPARASPPAHPLQNNSQLLRPMLPRGN